MKNRLIKRIVYDKEQNKDIIETVNWMALYQSWAPTKLKNRITKTLRSHPECGERGAVTDP